MQDSIVEPTGISELLTVLDEEAGLLAELVDLSKIKKDVIIKNDIDTLKELTNKGNLLLGIIHKLEKKRLSIVSDISIALNEKESNITLAYLANIINDGTKSAKLNKLTWKLSQYTTELKEINEQNRVLIENAIDYIDYSINVIRGAIDPSVYVGYGNYSEQAAYGCFLDIRN